MDRILRFIFLLAVFFSVTVFATAAMVAMFNAIGYWIVSPFIVIGILICWFMAK